MKITVKPIRKDGKYPVTISFSGQPNAFGGRDPGKVCNEIWSADKVRNIPVNEPDAIYSGIPDHLLNI